MRIAVAGAGFMGRTHAPRWAEQQGVEVVAVYSRSLEKARELAASVGAQALDDLDALLAFPADVLDICLPTCLHAPVAIAALTRGYHVVCEKPIALNTAEGEQMQQAARQAKRLLLVAHVVRFWPEYAQLRALVAEGTIGRPTSATAARLQEGPGWVPDPDVRRRSNGGPVIDLQIHDDDFLCWLFGTPRWVTAWGTERHVYAGLGFEGGVAAVAEAACDMPQGFPFTSTLRVRGDAGAIEYVFQAGGVRPDQSEGRVSELRLYRPGEPVRRVEVPPEDPYTAEIKHFASCLRANQPSPVIPTEDAVRSLEVALSVRAALQSHGWPAHA